MKDRRARPRRHPIRNLPLKWSFMLYVLACALAAIVLSITAGAWFSNLQSDLYYSYEAQWRVEQGIPQDGAELINSEANIILSRAPYDIVMTEADARRYDLYGTMTFLSVVIVCLACVVATGVLFFNRKLRAPLRLVDDASSRIAAGDLDFTIAYDNRNEMGRLAASFETMRASLAENQRELWRMVEQRQQLNAAFAHDLRTPLTVLKGYAEYLRAYVPQGRVPEAKLLSTVDLMRGYITRLEGYTASMGAMQRLEEVRPVPRVIAFAALSKRLQAAAEMLRGVAGLTFVEDGDGDVVVDADMITQVLENLVSNAARYAARMVRVDVSRVGAVLRLAVLDDGPGFTADMLEAGVKPFQRQRTGDEESEHYGLGLYICSVLCQRHGGSLVIENDGGGKVIATFAALESPA